VNETRWTCNNFKNIASRWGSFVSCRPSNNASSHLLQRLCAVDWLAKNYYIDELCKKNEPFERHVWRVRIWDLVTSWMKLHWIVSEIWEKEIYFIRMPFTFSLTKRRKLSEFVSTVLRGSWMGLTDRLTWITIIWFIFEFYIKEEERCAQRLTKVWLLTITRDDKFLTSISAIPPVASR